MRIRKLSLFFALSAIVGCNSGKDRHIGTWSGMNGEGQSVVIILEQDNKATMIDKGDTLNEGKSTYIIDYTKEPIWLDLIPEPEDTVKCIIRFNDGEMELRSNPGRERHDRFDSNDKVCTAILKKV